MFFQFGKGLFEVLGGRSLVTIAVNSEIDQSNINADLLLWWCYRNVLFSLCDNGGMPSPREMALNRDLFDCSLNLSVHDHGDVTNF